ncbi:MAG: moeZ 2 [Chthoniobacteraceae bacterium]|nr:moeZ 2 [Chthoniobacteraceae bacterium]
MESPAPARLIDVRESDEWELCRIPGAELMALSEWPAVVEEKLTDQDEVLIVHCHHGGRSARAADFLIRNGYTNVRNLTGGIDAWSQEIDSAVPRY